MRRRRILQRLRRRGLCRRQQALILQRLRSRLLCDRTLQAGRRFPVRERRSRRRFAARCREHGMQKKREPAL